MPLIGGEKAKTRAGFSENVAREMAAGKDRSQSLAIAYAQKRRAKKHHKRHSSTRSGRH